MIPLTVMGKRQFALSKEAGRKAAKWIRQEHAEFFQHKLADPFIEVLYLSVFFFYFYRLLGVGLIAVVF